MYFCDQICTNAYNNVQQVFFICNFIIAILCFCSLLGGKQSVRGKHTHEATALVEKKQVNTDFSANGSSINLEKIAAKF